jgi:predicted HTH domain antitoxin
MRSGLDVHIPPSIADAIALPDDRKAPEIRRELACALYREGLLSFGNARERAGLSVYAFGQVLGTRGIERQYGDDALEEDIAYARR